MKLQKRCPKCCDMKPLDSFCKSKKESDGLHSWCRSCNNEYQRTRYANTPIEIRRERTRLAKTRLRINRLKTRYNLTPDEFDEMSRDQNHTCAICPSPISAIDHDHKTGRVRGLLCKSCNSGLGFFKDNAIFLNKAANYLVRSE